MKICAIRKGAGKIVSRGKFSSEFLIAEGWLLKRNGMENLSSKRITRIRCFINCMRADFAGFIKGFRHCYCCCTAPVVNALWEKSFNLERANKSTNFTLHNVWEDMIRKQKLDQSSLSSQQLTHLTTFNLSQNNCSCSPLNRTLCFALSNVEMVNISQCVVIFHWIFTK